MAFKQSNIVTERVSFSLNVQGVCGPDLKFYNKVCHWPGSVHDSRIFRNSALYVQLQEQNYDGHLLGDSAYPLSLFLMTPLLNPTLQSEVRYNVAQAKTRNPIERTFGVWKRRFRCLSIPMRSNLDTNMATICSDAVLHNLALQFRDGLENINGDDDDGDSDEENEQVLDIPNENVHNRYICGKKEKSKHNQECVWLGTTVLYGTGRPLKWAPHFV